MENETSTVFCVFYEDEDNLNYFGHNFDVLHSICKSEGKAKEVADSLNKRFVFIKEMSVSD